MAGKPIDYSLSSLHKDLETIDVGQLETPVLVSLPSAMDADHFPEDQQQESVQRNDVEQTRCDEDTETASEGADSQGTQDEDQGKAKKKLDKRSKRAEPWANIKPGDKNYAFEPDQKKRTDVLCARGITLKNLAMQLAARTHAEVFLKVQYHGARKEPYHFLFGDDFLLKGEGEEVEKFNSSMKRSAQDGCTEAFVEDYVDKRITSAVEKLSQNTPPSTTSSSNATRLFESPKSVLAPASSRRTSAAPGGLGCMRCGKDGDFIEVEGTKIPASFFVCSFDKCKGKKHNDCLGFPAVNYDDIKSIAPWFCDVHRGAGRKEIAVEEVGPERQQLQSATTLFSIGRRSSSRNRSEEDREPEDRHGTQAPSVSRGGRGGRGVGRPRGSKSTRGGRGH